jgi:hypothetical protein
VSQDNVIKLAQPGEFCDALTEVLRRGARTLLAQAVEAEVASFLESHADKLTEDGQRRLVRHGHLPERMIATAIGHVGVRQPRVRDRGAQEAERIRFSPSILPPYARRSKSLEVLIPILHLNGRLFVPNRLRPGVPIHRYPPFLGEKIAEKGHARFKHLKCLKFRALLSGSRQFRTRA